MKQFYLWSILFFIPLGVFAQNYSVEEQNEIQMAQQQVLELPNWNSPFGEIDFGTDDAMEDFIPTAGATQTFSPVAGDFFYDTGGPGGGGLNASGGPGTELPGNYLNCNCITTTTLSGVNQIEFTVFEVFGDFDWLKVYDGADTSGAVLYDSNTNSNTDTFAGMVALNGSGVFTGTSGSITFEFRASGVVDHTGWEVEIQEADGGGGGEYCGPITFEFGIEPITNVSFAGINNPSPASTSSPAHEDFTSISGDVTAGETYEIAVQGNTDGNWQNYITAFIDWNQNGILDDAGEIYEIGSITNSTGSDGIQAVSNITVPADAISGSTMMRVFKVYDIPLDFNLDPCAMDQNFGQVEDYTLNVTTGSSGGVDCGQGDDSNGFENGYQIGINTDFRNSDDFFVSADNTLNVQTIELNVLALEPIQSIDFTFRNDDGGSPGTTVLPQTVTGLVPYDQVLIGGAFGYNVYALYVDVDIDFDGGAAGTTYWMQPQATAAGGATGGVFWEITSLGSLGSPVHTSELMGPWVADPDGFDAVFKLHCEDVDPPTPPCNYTVTFDVEPISRVVVADIDNPSDPVVNGSPALEDFTSVEGHMTQGDSYDVAFEGNTGGNFTNFFTVFVDWNQDGDWTDDGEMYEIGSITNSTGTDGQQATGSITVPADALDGMTVMRVIKNYNTSPTNPCGTYNYGQAEDYTINVGGGTGEGCEWTVTVSDTSFGDEVSWELRDAGGTVVLSGGPYLDSAGGYTDTQTVTAEGPVEFYIESIGTFNDNSPSYSISNENGEIITGSITGGSETTHTISCDDLPPPPPAYNCEEQEVLSNALENGLFFGGDTDQSLAVDVIVGDEGFTVYGIDLNVFIDGNTDLDFSAVLYDDAAGLPGGVNQTSNATEIDVEFVGSAFGFDVYAYRVQFETPLVVEANTTYWLEIVSNGVAWEATSASVFGSGLVFNNTNTGGVWTLDSTTELVYDLICEPLGVSDMNSFDFTYYPNPVRDVLNIDAKQAIQSVSAFNLAGQKVMADAKVSNNGQVDVNSLAPGTYVFRVTLEGGQVETFKIIKR